MILPCMKGCRSHVYGYSPAAVKVCEYSSPRSRPADPKFPVSNVTVWVSSSRLTQRTVVPTGTVMVGGRNLESWISTATGDTARTSAPTARNAASVTMAAMEVRPDRASHPPRAPCRRSKFPTLVPTRGPPNRSMGRGQAEGARLLEGAYDFQGLAVDRMMSRK